ncbi:MAG: nicotinate-nucleotide adenylyltransferase [Eubacteriaceae bacterium]|nr:nicotinate-nucleotide adenylyltransferase [Eubacteriaceae bacterium]
MKKIGIIGGTFDPVHRGHISLAMDALRQAGLDEVMLMPAKLQPFKLNKDISSAEDRIEMLKLATEYQKGLTVSTVEMDMEGVSYTQRTLDKIRKDMGGRAELYFITGTDTYLKLGIWKDADKLLKENSFIVGERPGCGGRELRRCIREYEKEFGTKTLIIDNKRLDISATAIRKRVIAGEPVNDLVPEGVERYIYEHGLYK